VPPPAGAVLARIEHASLDLEAVAFLFLSGEEGAVGLHDHELG